MADVKMVSVARGESSYLPILILSKTAPIGSGFGGTEKLLNSCGAVPIEGKTEAMRCPTSEEGYKSSVRHMRAKPFEKPEALG